jgi:hypothetical protein
MSYMNMNIINMNIMNMEKDMAMEMAMTKDMDMGRDPETLEMTQRRTFQHSVSTVSE